MIDIQSLDVTRNDSDELRYHVTHYHYLKRWPHPTSYPFGYSLMINGTRYAPDGSLWGLIVMKKPQHLRQRGLFGYPGLITAWQVLDLARVWINPCLQGEDRDKLFHNRAGELVPQNLNVFSRMVSKVIHRIQWDWLKVHPPVYPDLPYHIRLVISYCQLEHHDGTGYRASGFVSNGLSMDGEKELYLRPLRQPQKAWHPTNQQLRLFED